MTSYRYTGEGLDGDVKATDHEIVESSVGKTCCRTGNKKIAMGFRRVNFCLFRNLLERIPGRRETL